MPAQKKHPSVRARANKASTAATLTADGPAREVPDLPGRPDGLEWHPAVLEFWEDVWSSPMAGEYVASDVHQLVMLAYLKHDFYTGESATDRIKAAVEIRLQRQAFGLDPYARRRLEWTIEGAEEAKDRGARRRAGNGGAGKPAGADPRAGLRAV